MASIADGPHASTRHVKDRRPAYTNAAANAISSLEQRLGSLEKRQPASSKAQASLTKVDAAAEIDTAIKDVERRFDTHDRRLTNLEETTEDCQNLRTTVKRIEDRVKPYDEYQEQALGAVKQLQELQSILQQSGSARASPERTTISASLSRTVNEHEASIREYNSRLLQVEDSIELVKGQPLSTHDLARSLIARLHRGDTLSEPTAVALRLALGGNVLYPAPDTSRPRQQATPVTDESEPVGPPVEPSIEAPPSIIKPASRKRRRINLGPQEVDGALNSFMSGEFSQGRQSEDVATPASKTISASAEKSPPASNGSAPTSQPRRTARATTQTKQQTGFMHWREANEQVKHMRPSSATPKKGAA
ncbi:hypothetical protein LTR97_011459 [Elasticomyces elasticus]|uniref:Uncharacterized protein n=1 Tax=Elasticomyces elasticus TaxID=574655 RepID=A0AAN7VYW5_9PEZI|nr:hypothetical protein LTR97_011459 [Elasticomyces elasticus]